MIGPVRVRSTGAALAAAALLAGAGTALAALTPEGAPYPVGAQPLSINSADFNGDGLPDVATINGTSSNVSVYLRQPGGGFAQETGSPFPVGSGPNVAAVGDYNGDGLPDLAVTSYVAGGVTILIRQRSGGFAQEGALIQPGGGLSGVATADFNGDGRLDLAVSLRDSNRVAILLRDPQNLGFALQTPFYTTDGQPGPMVAADFNGDGQPDLAVANDSGGSVTVLLGAPGGTFAAEGTPATGARAVGVATADFNGDGRPDLAVTNYNSATVSILLRQPGGGFAAEAGSPVAVSAAPAGLAAADLDGDGRPDLAIAANSGALDVLRRNAGGGFTRDPAIALAGTPNGVAAADFNRDSRQDLAVEAYSPDTFTALLNPAPPPPAPTATPTPLPPPVAGNTVNVKPVSGKVTLKRPGAKTYVPLTEGAQVPVGTSIDTRKGRITITAAQGKGKTASADFYDGLFTLTQTKGSKPVTTLKLTEKLSCPRSAKAAVAAAKKKSRKLWGDGSGSFRTRGQYSAATVRGTRWLTQDTCATTLTRVAKGVVSVRDEVKKKTVVVRAGKRYTARKRR
jgi:hypothetical protein